MHDTSAGHCQSTTETATVEPPSRAHPPPLDPAPEPALPLEYENPWPQWAAPSPLHTAVFWLGVRRVVIAGGVGLVAWALVSLVADVNRHVAPFAAGWGVGFIVLMLPLQFRSQPNNTRDARRKSRPPRPAAAGGPPLTGCRLNRPNRGASGKNSGI